MKSIVKAWIACLPWVSMIGCTDFPSVECPDADECAALATSTRSNDPEISAGYSVRACEFGHGSSCNDLGTIYDQGLIGVSQDPEQALAFFIKACNHDFGAACTPAAANMAKNDLQQEAFTLYQRACDNGDGAGCLEAGRMQQEGKIPEADRSQAMQNYDHACDAKSSEGCVILGRLHRDDENWAAAIAAYKQACDLGDQAACQARDDITAVQNAKQNERKADWEGKLRERYDTCVTTWKNCRKAKECDKKHRNCKRSTEKCDKQRSSCLKKRAKKCDIERFYSETFVQECGATSMTWDEFLIANP